ncbi:hypothetical protein OG735_37090 [Streptomyces sp. NBC_01210]|nr:hypothetical protein OG735_37090 [Streptomyces sp. NBC_01210]
MTPGRCCRAVRAAVFAATCVLLAALGHLLMSGVAVPWWAMSAGFATTAATAWILADRQRSVLSVTSTVVAAQAALHTGFSLAQAAVHPSVSDSASLAQQWARYLLCRATESGAVPPSEAVRVMTDAGLGHHLHQPPPGATAMAMTDGTTMSAGHDIVGMSPAGMLGAHLLAALLCGLWLAYGEQAAFSLLRAVAGWLVAPLRPLFRLPTPPHRPRVRARRDRRTRPLRQLLLSHAITSRGPPSGTAVI